MTRGICLFVTLCLLAGCGSAPPKREPTLNLEYQRFVAPIEENLAVNIGDHIFVEGDIARVPALDISAEIASSMPGAYGVPFSFSIDKTQLTLEFQRGDHEYFCAPESDRAASFPGLGSVVSLGDCVGVRKHQVTGELEWVVDNSEYNGTTTVWTRSVKETDDVTFEETTVDEASQHANLEAISFDGFHSGLLHFTFRKYAKGKSSEETFKFDYPPRRAEPIYGVRGRTFEVVDVSNTQMVYRWVSIPEA